MSTKVLSPREAAAFERWGDTPPPEDRAPEPEPVVPALPTEEELAAIREAARAAGHAEGMASGLADGRRQAARELETQVRALNSIIESLAEPLAAMDHTVEEQLAAVALEVGSALFMDELRATPEHVINLVREAVNALPYAAPRIEIYLNPRDLAMVREHCAESEDAWELVEDESLTVGGVRVVTAISDVDGTVEGRLAAFRHDYSGGGK